MKRWTQKNQAQLDLLLQQREDAQRDLRDAIADMVSNRRDEDGQQYTGDAYLAIIAFLNLHGEATMDMLLRYFDIAPQFNQEPAFVQGAQGFAKSL